MFNLDSDAKIDAMKREMASADSSPVQKEPDHDKQKSDEKQMSSQANDVKNQAVSQLDAGSDKESGDLSYNRMREAQRKYEKAEERIASLEDKITHLLQAGSNRELENRGIDPDKFAEMWEQNQAQAIYQLVSTSNQKVAQELQKAVDKRFQGQEESQRAYVDMVKQYPQLANITDPFTQEVNSQFISLKKLGVPEVDALKLATESIYGRKAKEGSLPDQLKVRQDEIARISRINQGQTIGKGTGESSSPTLELSYAQLEAARKAGIKVDDPSYQEFVSRNYAHMKRGK